MNLSNYIIICLSSLFFILFLTGCFELKEDSLSEEEVNDIFKRELSVSNNCTIDYDCTLLKTRCPLGCFSHVSKSHKDSLEELADNLIGRYESGGISCIYSCIQPGVTACVHGKCTGVDIFNEYLVNTESTDYCEVDDDCTLVNMCMGSYLINIAEEEELSKLADEYKNKTGFNCNIYASTIDFSICTENKCSYNRD